MMLKKFKNIRIYSAFAILGFFCIPALGYSQNSPSQIEVSPERVALDFGILESILQVSLDSVGVSYQRPAQNPFSYIEFFPSVQIGGETEFFMHIPFAKKISWQEGMALLAESFSVGGSTQTKKKHCSVEAGTSPQDACLKEKWMSVEILDTAFLIYAHVEKGYYVLSSAQNKRDILQIEKQVPNNLFIEQKAWTNWKKKYPTKKIYLAYDKGDSQASVLWVSKNGNKKASAEKTLKDYLVQSDLFVSTVGVKTFPQDSPSIPQDTDIFFKNDTNNWLNDLSLIFGASGEEFIPSFLEHTMLLAKKDNADGNIFGWHINMLFQHPKGKEENRKASSDVILKLSQSFGGYQKKAADSGWTEFHFGTDSAKKNSVWILFQYTCKNGSVFLGTKKDQTACTASSSGSGKNTLPQGANLFIKSMSDMSLFTGIVQNPLASLFLQSLDSVSVVGNLEKNVDLGAVWHLELK